MFELIWEASKVVVLDSVVTFGRRGDITPGSSNPYMSRVVGIVEPGQSLWNLSNVGNNGAIKLVSRTGWITTVPEGQGAAIAVDSGEITFFAGSEKYRLTWSTDQAAAMPSPSVHGVTTRKSSLFLTEAEAVVMATFGQPIFSGGSGILTQAQVARRLSVSRKTIQGHIERVAKKVDFYTYEGGVRSFDSTVERVQYLIDIGIIRSDMVVGDL